MIIFLTLSLPTAGLEAPEGSENSPSITRPSSAISNTILKSIDENKNVDFASKIESQKRKKTFDKVQPKKPRQKNVKQNSEASKSESPVSTCNPVTPDVKRLKAVDLTILGVSPSTPSINKRNSKGETPLHVVCIKVS